MEKSYIDRVFSHPVGSIALAIGVHMLWGCAFPFIKVGYELFRIASDDLGSILIFAGVRFGLSGVIVLLLASIVKRKPLLLPLKKSSLKIIGLALLQTSVQYAFFYAAAMLLTGKVGSLLIASSSFMAVVLAHCLYGSAERITPRKAVGCIIGFSGVTIACLSPDNGFTLLGAAFMLTAALALALSGPINKILCREFDGFLVAGYNLGIGGLCLVILGLLWGGNLALASAGGWAYLDLAALCFIACGGHTINTFLMKNNPVSRVAVFAMCIPVTTNIVSAIIFPETSTFDALDCLAILLVCSGIYFVNKPKKEAAR